MLTETISTLAHMARFIIADITEPKCIPHELASIVPTLSVPVKPLLLKGSTGEYAMFKDLRQKYHWVLAVYRYKSSDELIESLEPKVIVPAEKKAKAESKAKEKDDLTVLSMNTAKSLMAVSTEAYYETKRRLREADVAHVLELLKNELPGKLQL